MTKDFFEDYEPLSDEELSDAGEEMQRRMEEGEPLFQLSHEQIVSLKESIDIDEIVTVLGGEMNE